MNSKRFGLKFILGLSTLSYLFALNPGKAYGLAFRCDDRASGGWVVGGYGEFAFECDGEASASDYNKTIALAKAQTSLREQCRVGSNNTDAFAVADGIAFDRCRANAAAGVIDDFPPFTRDKFTNTGPLNTPSCHPPDGRPLPTTGPHACAGGIPRIFEGSEVRDGITTGPNGERVISERVAGCVRDLDQPHFNNCVHQQTNLDLSNTQMTCSTTGAEDPPYTTKYTATCKIKAKIKAHAVRFGRFCYIATPGCELPN